MLHSAVSQDILQSRDTQRTATALFLKTIEYLDFLESSQKKMTVARVLVQLKKHDTHIVKFYIAIIMNQV